MSALVIISNVESFKAESTNLDSSAFDKDFGSLIDPFVGENDINKIKAETKTKNKSLEVVERIDDFIVFNLSNE